MQTIAQRTYFAMTMEKNSDTTFSSPNRFCGALSNIISLNKHNNLIREKNDECTLHKKPVYTHRACRSEVEVEDGW